MLIIVFSIVLIFLLVSVLLFVAYKKEEKLSYVNNSGMRADPKPQSNDDKSNNPAGTIFYHEDDFCQVELIASENAQNAKQDAESIARIEEKNLDGDGFRDIQVRKTHKIHLNSRRINLEELDKIFAKTEADRHSQVATGYGQHEESSRNTIGYGSGYSAIYFDFNSDGIVQNIWMTNISTFKGHGITSALNEIGIRWSLFLVDWNRFEFVNLKEMTEIERYLGSDESDTI